ncbi:hypothetical protein [uncultured Winogradskyella sp.]|uniref:hypothetical protein n=1 Tax=uncultured Winogradskyella sp. TaxID=395353 RepID=UPI00263373A5|nr:hypothetical protein [uncultured Winogradskyella sp.]
MIIRINNIELNKYELLHLINSGKSLSAIKLVKDKTNMGLKECKDVIDNLIENPNFYDGKDYIPETKILKAYNKPIKQRSKRGSHIIKSNNSNYKNYVIIFLLLCIVILVYMYNTK